MQRKNRHLPVAFTAVELKDRLWAPRQRAVRERTVPFLYGQMVKIGTIEALDVTKPPGPLAFPYRKNNTSTSVMYWDSDIAKWIETASYTLATHPDPALDALIDDVVARIARAQEPDGYFNSFFQRREPAKKWSNLRDWHELYCIGHMIEAAVAHNQATGKTNLLDIVRRQVDLVAKLFGPNEGQKRGYCGHEEIELALVRLYRLTGERRYLDLASYFIDERGRAAALLRHRGAGARRRSGRLLVHDLPLQPEPRAGARAGPRRRSRRARHVPLLRHGRPRGREGGRRPARGLPPAVARPQRQAALCHRRARPLGAQRGLHDRLRPAQRDGLRRDLRLGRAGVLGAPHGAARGRRALRRRPGAGAVQQFPERPVARRRALLLRQPAGQPRRPSPLDLAPLPVLPAQHRPPHRLARLLRLLDGARRTDGASLRAERRPPAGRRRQGGDQADEQLSLGRRDRLRDRSRDAKRSSRCACASPAGAARPSWPSTARGSTSRP